MSMLFNIITGSMFFLDIPQETRLQLLEDFHKKRTFDVDNCKAS